MEVSSPANPSHRIMRGLGLRMWGLRPLGFRIQSLGLRVLSLLTTTLAFNFQVHYGWFRALPCRVSSGNPGMAKEIPQRPGRVW